MANSITGFSDVVTKTVISSVDFNTKINGIVSGSAIWQKYTVDYTDINTTTAAFTATLYNLDPKESALAYTVKHSTAFAGGSVSTITVSIGIAGENDKHASEFDVRQSVADTTFDLTNVNLIESFANTTTIYAKFTAAGANLDSLTAGSLDVWVLKNLLP